MKYYIISDTHFGHDAIIDYCNRPEDHEDMIMNNLNLLTQDTCLIHLGDICIGNNEEWHQYIESLVCRKILCVGNHDPKTYSWYMEHGWDFACDTFKLKYCNKIICFSHKPQPWDGDWEINIHGHLHNLGHRDNEYRELKHWHRLYAPELFDYKPIELSQFIQTTKKENKNG